MMLKFNRGGPSMHTVIWTYKLPASISKAQLIDLINATARNYRESQV